MPARKILIYVEPEVDDALDQIVSLGDYGTTKPQVVKEAVRQFIASDKGDASLQAARMRAFNSARSFVLHSIQAAFQAIIADVKRMNEG